MVHCPSLALFAYLSDPFPLCFLLSRTGLLSFFLTRRDSSLNQTVAITNQATQAVKAMVPRGLLVLVLRQAPLRGAPT